MKNVESGNLSHAYSLAADEKLFVKPFDEVVVGDIFLICKQDMRHTGFISEIGDDRSWFEYLSYTRLIPEKEGLGYLIEQISLEKEYTFFGIKTKNDAD